jgi:sulfite exporter TauE/SafE
MAYKSFQKQALHGPSILSTFATKIFGFVLRSKNENNRAFFTGLVTPILPCGHLYAFGLAAIASPDRWSAVFVMALVWLGSLPAVVLGPSLVSKIMNPLRQRAPHVAAIFFLVAGIASICSKFNWPMHEGHGVGHAGAKSCH